MAFDRHANSVHLQFVALEEPAPENAFAWGDTANLDIHFNHSILSHLKPIR